MIKVLLSPLRAQMFIITICVSLFFSFALEAKIGLNVSLIYKKGIGKGFFLSTEQHSIQSVDERERIVVSMKNGISADISAFFVQSVHDYGPSAFVRVKSEITSTVSENKGAKKSENVMDIYLGQSKSHVFQTLEDEQVELIIVPVAL